METETAATGDKPRVYWSTTMERYFIQLMFEQKNKGNMVGHTFTKQGWEEMLSSFNAKFRSEYGKEALKTRYANLREEFNDLKNILSTIGFSWDETYHMVVAEDYVWDAYIKEHPYARNYRTSTLPNVDDLWEIFGYSNADGRYSLCSHDFGFNNDVQGGNSGDRMGSNVPTWNTITRKTEWTTTKDQFFIELLIHHMNQGNTNNNGSKKIPWRDILAMFNEKVSYEHGLPALRHRFRQLHKYYNDITHILKEQGFSWNAQRQMLEADDYVWNAYIKENPHAKTYKVKTFPNYGDMQLVFRNAFDDELCNLQLKKNHKEVASEINAGDKAGNLKPSGADRPRTHWTSEMDLCFINLLVEQVKNGNIFDQTIRSHVWNDMVKSFNEQLNTQHDINVLRHRYKNLKRWFKDVSNLLQQSGFSWDSKREMVVAEGHVWEAYTEVHPEVRYIRSKSLSGFSKLSAVFGSGSSHTSYTSSSHNADPSVESQILLTGEEKNGDLPYVYDAGSTIEWTESMENLFIDLMVEQVNRGNIMQSSFSEEAWTYMIREFSSKLGLQCDRKFLEDEYIVLMKRHNSISKLLSHEGFAWDETLQMILADNHVWQAYLQDNPEAVAYINKSLYAYPALCMIFGNKVSYQSTNSAQGQFQYTKAINIANEMDMYHHGTSENFLLLSNSEIPNQATEMPNQQQNMDKIFENSDFNNNGRHTIPPRHSRKRSNDMRMKEDAVRAEINKNEEKKEKSNNTSFQDALLALRAMQDELGDEELVLDACDLLEDEKKAFTFLTLNSSMRKKWLLRKLRP